MAGADQPWRAAAAPFAVAACLVLSTWDLGIAVSFGLAAVAALGWLARMRALAACAAAWLAVFVAVRVLPGPYDSWAGLAALPVLAGYVAIFLTAWAVGRRLAQRAGAGAGAAPPAGAGTGTAPPAGPGAGSSSGAEAETASPAGVAPAASPTLTWPGDARLLGYLLVVLTIAVLSAVLRFRGVVPPLLADNPDAARQVLRERSSILIGLLSEGWTLGMAVALLRGLTTGGRRWLYLTLAGVFTVGAALGASKNSVLVGLVPALIAALSVRRSPSPRLRVIARTPVLVLLGVAVLGAAVFLGGQRTLAGTGAFETDFRARYGQSALAASAGSLDLSLSSSTETFGRLWAQRDNIEPGHGAYSLMFLGPRVEPLVGKADLYGVTSQLSEPYYMNTATFVAVPLLDYGPAGAAGFLALLGLGVGLVDRRLEGSGAPAKQLGRAFVVYFALFGVYELYPFLYATWLGLIPGLWILHRLGRTRDGR